jgi:Fic family protein
MSNTEKPLRDKDRAVLTCIRDGDNDVQQIKATTTLSKREINYSFEKLEEMRFIDVSRPDGQVERIIDGQKRVFDAPKEATLTEDAIQYLQSTANDGDRYQDLTRDELVRTVRDLEARIDRLESGFESFRQQVLQKLDG